MATFLVLTDTDHDHEKVMEIVRQKSMMHNNRFGGPGFCDTEIVGSWNDYKIFEEAIKNGQFKAELQTLSMETE